MMITNALSLDDEIYNVFIMIEEENKKELARLP